MAFSRLMSLSSFSFNDLSNSGHGVEWNPKRASGANGYPCWPNHRATEADERLGRGSAQLEQHLSTDSPSPVGLTSYSTVVVRIGFSFFSYRPSQLK